MAWQIESVGERHAVAEGIRESIDRAGALRSFLDSFPASGPVEVRARATANGGFSLNVTPIGTAADKPTLLTPFVSLAGRFKAFVQRKCAMCGAPRELGSRFCGPACHTEWRVQEASRKGVVLDD